MKENKLGWALVRVTVTALDRIEQKRIEKIRIEYSFIVTIYMYNEIVWIEE